MRGSVSGGCGGGGGARDCLCVANNNAVILWFQENVRIAHTSLSKARQYVDRDDDSGAIFGDAEGADGTGGAAAVHGLG